MFSLSLHRAVAFSFTMAANDYYNSQFSRPQPQPYYNYSQETDISAPPYTSQTPLYLSRSRQAEPSPVSPFEAPFDDHVYPARPQDSQYSFDQDSTYYSQGGGGRHKQGSISSSRDDILLREHPKHTGETDHVYEAPMPQISKNLRDPMEPAKSRLAFGIFKRDRRIPWVVYILTIIQFSVFIAEIVKNGKLSSTQDILHLLNST